jgi:hypothetical protein
MSVLDRFRTGSTDSTDGYQPIQVTNDLVVNATNAIPDGERAIVVRPYKSNGGIEAMDEVLTSLHEVQMQTSRSLRHPRGASTNVSPAHAAEIRYGPAQTPTGTTTERVLTLQYVPAAGTYDSFTRQLEDKYPSSEITHRKAGFLDISPGNYLAGTTLDLRRYTLYPINNIALDGFRSDPIGAILKEIVADGADTANTERDSSTASETNVAVQVMFQPANRSWLQGVANGGGVADGRGDRDWDSGAVGTPIEGTPSVQDLTYQLRQPTIEHHNLFGLPFGLGPTEVIEHPPSKRDKDVATMLEEQDGKAWRLFVRIFAVSPDSTAAAQRVKHVAGMYRNYYEFRSEQTFLPNPMSPAELPTQFERACRREWEDAGIVKTQKETDGMVNVPTAADVTTNKLRWSLAKPGDGVPIGTPRFDFDAVEFPENPTRAEKQAAMLDASEAGDPFMFGFGSKHGTEAGVFEEFTNAHIQVTGATRMGKTTFGTNFGSQVMGRGYGALIVVLGKQDDDEEFIAEWPADRPHEDFVFIDTSDTFDKRVRFNLLEIPEHLEPESTEHRSYTESLADDFCAAFAQAGGDSSLYPLMRGITRTLVRGMAKSGRVCTPVDLAAACSRPENMDTFAQWMSDERIHFVEDTAKRFAEEKDDSDLEPIARRMDEITHNGNLREWLAARDPTVRVQNIVNEGKVAVLRIDPSLGETERAFSINPVVRRFAHAKKMAHKTDTNTDPFYFIWDEADKAITPHSNVGAMLSEFGGYGARFCLLYQAPSYQLPKSLRNATEAQIDTTISFRTKGRDADFIQKQHSDDITAGDLRDLPRFSFYMNTDTKNHDSTSSFRVDAFEPAREIREQVGGKGGMTDEEIQEMKRQSVERYGDMVETAEELKAESHFYTDAPGEAETTVDGASLDDFDPTDAAWRNLVLKAVDDESIRQGNPHGGIALSTDLDRLRRYLPGGGALTDANKAWREVIQPLPDAYLTAWVEDGDTYVKADDTSYMNVGISPTAGGKTHQQIMEDAYVPLTQLGFLVDILDQEADSMPDALATLDDRLYLDGIDDPDVITERVTNYRENHPELYRLAGVHEAYIEAEHSTGETQSSQTIVNLAAAHKADRRCLFLCRPDLAEKLQTVLTDDNPGCHSTHPKDGERRFYTKTKDLTIDGETMTRPGPANGENIWVHDQQIGQYILRDTDGAEHARFDTAAEIFNDASQYPNGGERNIKPPVIPEYEFDGDDPTAAEWDIIIVPEAETTEEDERRLLTPLDLTLYQHNRENIPLSQLAERLADTDTETEPEDTPSANTTGRTNGETTQSNAGTTGTEDRDEESDEDSDADTDASSEPDTSGDSPRKFPRF